MDLARKFEEVDSYHSVKISSLEVDQKYPITRAEQISIRYGPTILLSIRDSPSHILTAFVPRRYFSFLDTSNKDTNSEKVTLSFLRGSVSAQTPLN
jgi:hypothetical protein